MHYETFSMPLSELDGLEAEWVELATSTSASAWNWPGWYTAWQSAFSSAEPLLAYGARSGGRLAALGVFRRRGLRLQAAANVHSPWFGLLAEDAPAREAVLGAMLDDRPQEIELRHLMGGGEDERAFLRAAAARRYRVLRTHVEEVPYVSVGSDWEAYARRKPGRKLIRNVGRLRRRLSELGAVSFEWLSPDPTTVEELLADGLRVERSGWKERSGSAIAMSPSLTLFYGDAARWAAERGWLRLGFLRLDGRAIAFDYGFEKDGVISLLKGGYDESFASLAPGILLLHDEMLRAFTERAGEVDLLGECEPYKLRWADGIRPRVTLAAFAPTPAGRTAFALRWLELRARGAALRAVPPAARQRRRRVVPEASKKL